MTITILTSLILAASNAWAQPAGSSASQFSWTPVKLSKSSMEAKVTGRVVPLEGALNIESARVQGRVLAILAREGDQIKVGHPLFLVSSSECLSLGEELRVAVSRKIDDLIDGARKRERQLGISLRDGQCRIVSNYAGTITKRNVESGGSINIGDALMTILDTKRLSVEMDIAERDLSRVQKGQKVSFHLAIDPSRAYTTKIKAIVPAIDVTSRTSRVRLEPVPLSNKANLDGLVFGEILTGQNEAVYIAPSQSVVFNKNSRFVVKGPEDKPKPVEIEVLSEVNGVTAFRPKQPEELSEKDQIASASVIYLIKKLQEESEEK